MRVIIQQPEEYVTSVKVQLANFLFLGLLYYALSVIHLFLVGGFFHSDYCLIAFVICPLSFLRQLSEPRLIFGKFFCRCALLKPQQSQTQKQPLHQNCQSQLQGVCYVIRSCQWRFCQLVLSQGCHNYISSGCSENDVWYNYISFQRHKTFTPGHTDL